MQENKMPRSIGVGWPCSEGVEYFKNLQGMVK
jgi:hypothetical protein